MAIKRILVPVDFSADSLGAVHYAHAFARSFGAELTLLHVIEPIYYATPAEMYVANPSVAMLIDEQRRIAKQQLERLSGDLAKKGQRARAVLKTGAAAQAIADTAKSRKADLIIMSTHGRTGLAHMFLGSVAEKVVRTASCAVLTVPRAALPKTRRRRTKR